VLLVDWGHTIALDARDEQHNQDTLTATTEGKSLSNGLGASLGHALRSI
jgi:hypothetical protein